MYVISEIWEVYQYKKKKNCRDVTSKKFLARKMWCKQEEASTIALEMMQIKPCIEILVTASAHLWSRRHVILDSNFKNLCLTRSLIDLFHTKGDSS